MATKEGKTEVKDKTSTQDLIVYESKDGQKIELSFEVVRNYLISGKKELVTAQEIFYFIGICKARGLNPFKKDCYLIKYSQGDSAQIVTSIDFFRSRAVHQENCQGWASGPIVLTKDNKLRYSNGLVLDDEKLVGGWFEAQPKGWEKPFRHEVNLQTFIKHKTDGSVTKFWAKENQAFMIAKIAESQGLRRVWPDEFGHIYEKDEIIDQEGNILGEIEQGANREPIDLKPESEAEERPEEQKDNRIPDSPKQEESHKPEQKPFPTCDQPKSDPGF